MCALHINNSRPPPLLTNYANTPTFAVVSHSVRFTPTVEHCSMATLIGLCIRVQLLRRLPPRFKVDVEVRECHGGGGDDGVMVAVLTQVAGCAVTATAYRPPSTAVS